MKQIFNNIVASFNTKDIGFSARKLTAFTIVGMILYCHFKWVNHDNVNEVLIIDCVFVAFLLGMVTVEQIIKLKNGTTTTTQESTNNSGGTN